MNKKTLARMHTKKYDYAHETETNKSYKDLKNRTQKKMTLKERLKRTIG